jgi:hypothetical protein
MPTYSWLVAQNEISAAALTVRAQAVSLNDTGRLSWDVFFPRKNVTSTKISELSTIDFRPVADRREWNARGRLVPLQTPAKNDYSIIPIETRDALSEQEMNKITEETRGNESIIQNEMGVRLQDRVESLAMANYRRIEVDAYTIWSTGSIVQKEPEAGRTLSTSFGIDSGQQQTAGTAWNDASLNAYDEFLAWYIEGLDTIGAAEGVMLRRATLNAILADAPDLANGVKMTRTQLEDRLTQDIGSAFRFFVNENSLDIFNDGGTAYTRTKVLPAEKVLMIPAGNRVGVTAFAPVVRAMDIARTAGDAGIDVNGNTVYMEASNGGRQLDIECQLNALPVPNKSVIWTIDAGV